MYGRIDKLQITLCKCSSEVLRASVLVKCFGRTEHATPFYP
jgi:hypothetical protein